MGTVRGALLISLVERYLLLALALGSNIVLARLLTPEQIGIYSVSMAVLGMAQVLRDFGIGSYLVQARTLDDEQTGTAFGLSMLLGTAFFLVVFLSAPWVADYYRDERVAGTLRICAFNFIVLPFSTVPMAVLRRELKFKQTMHASIASGVVTAFLSAGLAFAGLGVNALALGAMLGNVALVVVLALVAPRSCFPRPRLTHWRAILSFGGQTSMTGVLNSIAVDMNDLVVGKVLGFQSVAILSRAQGLMNMFNRDLMGAIRNVALPAFASAHRDGVALHGPYARSVGLVTLFAWCFHALVSIYALEVLHLLYGAQWHGAAPLVPLFCLSGAVAAINALTPNLLTGIGRIGLVTRVEVTLQPMRMALIAGAALLFKSVEACAIAFMLSAVIAAPVFGAVRRHAMGPDGGAMRAALLKSGAVAAACALPPIIQMTLVGWGHKEPISPLAWLPVAGLGVLFGLLAAELVKHPLVDEPHVQRLLRVLLRRPAPSPSSGANPP